MASKALPGACGPKRWGLGSRWWERTAPPWPGPVSRRDHPVGDGRCACPAASSRGSAPRTADGHTERRAVVLERVDGALLFDRSAGRRVNLDRNIGERAVTWGFHQGRSGRTFAASRGRGWKFRRSSCHDRGVRAAGGAPAVRTQPGRAGRAHLRPSALKDALPCPRSPLPRAAGSPPPPGSATAAQPASRPSPCAPVPPAAPGAVRERRSAPRWRSRLRLGDGGTGSLVTVVAHHPGQPVLPPAGRGCGGGRAQGCSRHPAPGRRWAGLQSEGGEGLGRRHGRRLRRGRGPAPRGASGTRPQRAQGLRRYADHHAGRLWARHAADHGPRRVRLAAGAGARDSLPVAEVDASGRAEGTRADHSGVAGGVPRGLPSPRQRGSAAAGCPCACGESGSKTASKESVYLLSRSRRTKRSDSTRLPRSAVRLRACWVAHCAVGWAVMPVMRSRRVPCSPNAGACSRLPVIVSTWKKSAAMIPSAWG